MKLLLIEDHSDLAEMTLILLRSKLECETEWASSGADGIARAVETVPDAILVDIGLPDMSGIELARRLRSDARLAKAVLIAVSGFDDPSDHEEALRAGFDAYFSKPLDFGRLRTLLEERCPKRSEPDVGPGQD